MPSKVERARSLLSQLSLDELRSLVDELQDLVEQAQRAPELPEGMEVLAEEVHRAVTYRLVTVACGKARCRRCGGKRKVHGPYWYGFFRQSPQKVRCIYIGKEKRLFDSAAELVTWDNQKPSKQRREDADDAGGAGTAGASPR
jgi:hypothetical protein